MHNRTDQRPLRHTLPEMFHITSMNSRAIRIQRLGFAEYINKHKYLYINIRVLRFNFPFFLEIESLLAAKRASSFTKMLRPCYNNEFSASASRTIRIITITARSCTFYIAV